MNSTSGYNGKTFSNPVPTSVMQPGAFLKMLRGYFNKPKDAQPAKTPGPFHPDLNRLNDIPGEGIRITLIGHSSLIIDIDGIRFLTDPVWCERASPFSFLGPKRFFAPPIALKEIHSIDYVLLSHDHYDHLDKDAMRELGKRKIKIVTMRKVGRRLIDFGIDADLITELDWWEDYKLQESLTITAMPSRHFSGRTLSDRFTTLWGSFGIRTKDHNIYFGADSGYYEGFRVIGEKYGPFDIACLDSGAYNPLWAEIHMGPENAVQAAIDLGAKLLMPIHWGTFDLAMHPWKEPIERVIKEAAARHVSLFIPAPGETHEAEGAFNSQWWER